MKTPEAFEKAAVCKYLDSLSLCWYMKPATFGFGKSGVPDIIVCLGGRFVGLEIKREGKPPTAIQMRRMAEIRVAGGLAFWGTAEKVLKELNECFQNFQT